MGPTAPTQTSSNQYPKTQNPEKPDANRARIQGTQTKGMFYLSWRQLSSDVLSAHAPHLFSVIHVVLFEGARHAWAIAHKVTWVGRPHVLAASMASKGMQGLNPDARAELEGAPVIS